MKKIVRLTESDLTRIIEKVLNEQSTNMDDLTSNLEMFKNIYTQFITVSDEGIQKSTGRSDYEKKWYMKNKVMPKFQALKTQMLKLETLLSQ